MCSNTSVLKALLDLNVLPQPGQPHINAFSFESVRKSHSSTEPACLFDGLTLAITRGGGDTACLLSYFALFWGGDFTSCCKGG